MCEVFFSPRYGDGVDALSVDRLDQTGIRSVFIRCANDEVFFEGFLENRQELTRRTEQLIQRYDTGRTQVGVGPLIPWGWSAEAFEDAIQLSQQKQVLLHLHTSETPEYNDLVRQRTG